MIHSYSCSTVLISFSDIIREKKVDESVVTAFTLYIHLYQPRGKMYGFNDLLFLRSRYLGKWVLQLIKK